MKDQKTTILGILTIIATLALAGKAVLRASMPAPSSRRSSGR